MNEVINKAFTVLDHFACQKNIKLVKNLEGEETHFKKIYGDERRYLQVLINFVSNALKFS